MKKPLIRILCCLTASAAIYFTSCQSPISPPAGQIKDDPSFAQDIQPILTNNCTSYSCHGAAAQARMTLVQSRAYASLVNVASTEVPSKKRVLPFDAANSYLVIKIEGRQAVGARMPAATDRLTPDQIKLIKNWIGQGARTP